MSVEKNMNARIQQKHDIESNWLKAVNFIPKQGELIVYDRDDSHDYERIKIGDGITIISNLPFIDDNIRKIIPDKIYKQNEAPTDPEEGALWLDLDEDGGGSVIQGSGGNVDQTVTVTKTDTVIRIDVDEGEEVTVNSDTTEAITLIHHGKNFLPPFFGSGTKNGITYSTNEDGSVNLSGTATANTWLNFPANKRYPYLPAGKYIASCECEGLENEKFFICIEGNYKTVTGGTFYGFLLDSDGKKATGTVDIAYEANSYIYIASGTEVNTIAKYQLELGDTATEFEAYKGEVLEAQNLPVTVEAFAGVNHIYTNSGDTLTASYLETVVVDGIAGEWAGKKWVCIGDSLTEVNIRTDKRYHDYIAESTGVTVVNMGASGTGYAKKADTNMAFYQRISSVPTDANVVTIFGSFNDMSAGLELGTPTDTGTETLCGCINTTIDNLIAIMPTVSFGIVSPTPWQSHYPSNTEGAGTKYCDALRSICEYRSIPFLDLYRCSNLRPWTEEGRSACYTKDDGNGVHPDETGHKLIAPRFKAFLETLIL